jgi:ubiquinone/menaquinone biosynthesis C-methylase UbiE
MVLTKGIPFNKSNNIKYAGITMSEDRNAEIYNNMADEYDDIKDLWYGWLFSRLHYFIVKHFKKNATQPSLSCLDIGCGTGFQTILLSLCGHKVTGIDISSGLIEKARQKNIQTYISHDLFESPHHFAHTYSKKMRLMCAQIRNSASFQSPTYQVASATNLPYENSTFDVVNCCGSTLSAIEDYQSAMNEMTRVLRPGGIILLEVENKYNLDLLWPIIDTLVGGSIGYDQKLKISLSNVFSNIKEHVKTDFPFSTHNEEVLMPIWLFSSRKIIHEFKQLGIKIEEIRAIHNFTNIIPSVALDRTDPHAWLVTLFSILSKFETITSSLPLFRRLGCSLVIFGRKK